jgi:hypothetical protein
MQLTTPALEVTRDFEKALKLQMMAHFFQWKQNILLLALLWFDEPE